MLEQLPEIQRLTEREKFQLASELWDHLAVAEPEADPAIVELLEHRHAEYLAGREPARPWLEIKRDVEASRAARSRASGHTAILHQGEADEGGYWATCLEGPGANGQGETEEECLSDLAEAVRLILQVNEEDALRDDPHAKRAPLVLA